MRPLRHPARLDRRSPIVGIGVRRFWPKCQGSSPGDGNQIAPREQATGGSAMATRVADVLIETLEAAGVRTCYGIVGDTLNRIAHAIDRSKIDWVHMRHEEAGAFAASAEAAITGRLTACAGTCGPGSLHFINGLYEANRNSTPLILIATQIVRPDIGFESIQEIDFNVFKGCSVFCEMIVTPEQARRKTVAACQAARDQARRRRARRACRRRQCRRAQRTAIRRACSAPAAAPRRCRSRRDRRHPQQKRCDHHLCRRRVRGRA
jgi:hypothetical protein